ncbi:type II toxin-antitoxin system Phd/YefM family antitoxin [Candidatus Poriferisocius sp.]|uniref:type II toxin-antitoxin system Phd/YefM family antitoxin n=1 Tax=Candidatus Poriferisocius sp. TaxID=3101276 RepID=UPI003B595361
MTTLLVNTHEAKSRLSELIREAESGSHVIVARNGRPVAKIIAWPPQDPERVLGSWAGRVSISGDIVGSDDEVIAIFEKSAEETLD